jgi:hypothetical protein
MQQRAELQTFVEFYLTHARDAATKVAYVPLSDDYYPTALAALKAKQYTTNDQQTFNNMYK